MSIRSIVIVVIALLSPIAPLRAEQEPTTTVGLIASLSGFAASYGTAVREGAELAVSELAARGTVLELAIEDDHSNAAETAKVYQKLRTLSKVSTVIGGSWWLNSIVKKAEADGVLLLSCETLWNKDAVAAPNHFLLQGDLREWMRAYEPIIARQGWKRGTIVRYSSGFGETLADEMALIFGVAGRTWLGAVEYSDITLADAGSVALEVRKKNPDVVYIDAQPGGYAVLLRKLHDLGLTRTAVLAHTEAFDAMTQKLVDPKLLEGTYYTMREPADPEFVKRFAAHFGRSPQLNADLGYYAVLIASTVATESDRVSALRKGVTIGNKRFAFDEHNAHTGMRSIVYRFENGVGVRVHE